MKAAAREKSITKLPSINARVLESAIFLKKLRSFASSLSSRTFWRDATLTRAERHDRMEELIEEFRLSHVRKNKGYALSGGERRRTEIARMLTIEPKYILLDEPFAGIDPIAIDDIQQIIARLRSRGIVLITDHNVREALNYRPRLYYQRRQTLSVGNAAGVDRRRGS